MSIGWDTVAGLAIFLAILGGGVWFLIWQRREAKRTERAEASAAAAREALGASGRAEEAEVSAALEAELQARKTAAAAKDGKWHIRGGLLLVAVLIASGCARTVFVAPRAPVFRPPTQPEIYDPSTGPTRQEAELARAYNEAAAIIDRFNEWAAEHNRRYGHASEFPTE